MTVIIEGGKISDEERESYEAYVKDKYKGKTITLLKIKLDGEFAELETHTKSESFQRVRRITGYLNEINRFCDAKQAEVKDRKPHGVDYTHTVSGLLDD